MKTLKIKRGTPIRNITLGILITYSIMISVAFWAVATGNMAINPNGKVYAMVDQPFVDPFAETASLD